MSDDTFRALVIHDAHLTHETPPAYKVDYWILLKTVLQSMFAFARINNANAILWTGDVFHRKAPSKNPIHFLIELMTILRDAGVSHYGIAGNHDVKFGTAKLGLEGQPLALLMETPFFHMLDNKPVYFPAGTHTVRVEGRSYHHGKAHEMLTISPKKKGEILVVLGHFWFGPNSGEFFGEPVFGPDFLGDGPADVYLIGHHHEDQGHRVIDGKHYLVHGSITRTGAHKSDLIRQPSAGWLEISGSEIQSKILRLNKFPSAADTMDLEKREQLRHEEEELDAFVSQLSDDADVYDPLGILDELNPERRVKLRTRDYLEIAEAEVG